MYIKNKTRPTLKGSEKIYILNLWINRKKYNATKINRNRTLMLLLKFGPKKKPSRRKCRRSKPKKNLIVATKIPTEKKSSRRQNLLFGPSCNDIFCLRADFLSVYDLTFVCLWVDFYFVYEYDILSTSRYVYESVCLRVDSLPLYQYIVYSEHLYFKLFSKNTSFRLMELKQK